jgi:hypothetical protein
MLSEFVHFPTSQKSSLNWASTCGTNWLRTSLELHVRNRAPCCASREPGSETLWNTMRQSSSGGHCPPSSPPLTGRARKGRAGAGPLVAVAVAVWAIGDKDGGQCPPGKSLRWPVPPGAWNKMEHFGTRGTLVRGLRRVDTAHPLSGIGKVSRSGRRILEDRAPLLPEGFAP